MEERKEKARLSLRERHKERRREKRKKYQKNHPKSKRQNWVEKIIIECEIGIRNEGKDNKKKEKFEIKSCIPTLAMYT